ncbi:hypothetical protein IAT38_003673 [Cryptococcus sp. DSM 104549]
MSVINDPTRVLRHPLSRPHHLTPSSDVYTIAVTTHIATATYKFDSEHQLAQYTKIALSPPLMVRVYIDRPSPRPEDYRSLAVIFQLYPDRPTTLPTPTPTPTTSSSSSSAAAAAGPALGSTSAAPSALHLPRPDPLHPLAPLSQHNNSLAPLSPLNPLDPLAPPAFFNIDPMRTPMLNEVNGRFEGLVDLATTRQNDVEYRASVWSDPFELNELLEVDDS